MRKSRPDVLAILMVFALAFGIFPNSVYSIDNTEPLKLRGDDLMKESSTVRTKTEYECGEIKGMFTIDVKRDQILVFEGSVNGKKLPAEKLASAKDNMLRNGAFDYVAFFCNESSYAFSFFRWAPNSPEPYTLSISGQL